MMLRPLFTCVAALALGALSPDFAQAAPLAAKAIQQVVCVSTLPHRTSDRSPNDPAPARAPGSSIFGAAGTDVAHTPFGTSDRTPSHHYRPPAN